MSTGPDHYRRAEELLATAYRLEAGSPGEQGALAAAQAHATLALAAATALASYRTDDMPVPDERAWLNAASVDPTYRLGNETAEPF